MRGGRVASRSDLRASKHEVALTERRKAVGGGGLYVPMKMCFRCPNVGLEFRGVISTKSEALRRVTRL